MIRAALATGLILAPQALWAEPVAEANTGVSVTVKLSGLRNTRGQVLACLTTKVATFPECDKDPQAQHLTVPAQNGPVLVFRHVAPGHYAVSLFHDENANARLDKSMGVPAEGYGFSRDAPVWFGPPRFRAAQFAVGANDLTLAIKVRYIL